MSTTPEKADAGYRELDERHVHVGYFYRRFGDSLTWHTVYGAEPTDKCGTPYSQCDWSDPFAATPCDVTPIYVREVYAETDALKPMWYRPLGLHDA